MDFLIEFLAELFIDGVAETTENKRFPKWVRYIAFGIIILLFSAITVLFVLIDIVMINNIKQIPVWLCILMLILTVFVIYKTIKYFRKLTETIRNKKM